MHPGGDDYTKHYAGAGYPPQMTGYYQQPYPGYPPPQQYQGYPPPGYNGYPPPPPPYSQAPPAVYYSQQPYVAGPEPRPAHTCIRCCLTMVIVLFLGSFAMSILTWIIFGEDVPVFNLNGLSMPDFNVTTNSFKATWDANMTVTSLNDRVKVRFNNLEGGIWHSVSMVGHNNSRVEPFTLEKNSETKSFNMKFSTFEPGQERDDFPVDYESLRYERNTSHVYFTLRLYGNAALIHESLWTRNVNIHVECMFLKVRFSGRTGPGYLVPEKERHRECTSSQF